MRLQDRAALNLCFDGRRVSFGRDVGHVKLTVRNLSEAAHAYLETTGGQLELYHMYRDVACLADRETGGRHGLQYDVTVVFPGCVGPEYMKTVGHYHPVTPGNGMTYPEVYEVLSGEATYLMQRPGEVLGEVVDAYVVKALPGDKVVIPPGYGHITINAGSEPLVMANWVAAEFESVYGAMKELKGGAYYLLSTGEWVKNPLYGEVPELRFEKVREYPDFGLISGVGMYGLIRQAPEKLRFLTHPEEFEWE